MDLFINVDYDGDIENYTKVGEEIGKLLQEIIFRQDILVTLVVEISVTNTWTKERYSRMVKRSL